jgi:HEPN domain-containing protein
MTRQHERAAQLLAKAEQDRHALEILARGRDVTDDIVGFHGQQAIEKALKAILALRAIAFRKTHDIAELLDLLKDGGVAYPEAFEKATALTPYAVEERYDSLPSEGDAPAAMDRKAMLRLVDDMLAWSREQVAPPEDSTGA